MSKKVLVLYGQTVIWINSTQRCHRLGCEEFVTVIAKDAAYLEGNLNAYCQKHAVEALHEQIVLPHVECPNCGCLHVR